MQVDFGNHPTTAKATSRKTKTCFTTGLRHVAHAIEAQRLPFQGRKLEPGKQRGKDVETAARWVLETSWGAGMAVDNRLHLPLQHCPTRCPQSLLLSSLTLNWECSECKMHFYTCPALPCPKVAFLWQCIISECLPKAPS